MIPVLEPKAVEEDSSTHHGSRAIGDNTPLTRTPLHTPLSTRKFQSSMQDLRRPSNLSQDIKNPLERVRRTNTLEP